MFYFIKWNFYNINDKFVFDGTNMHVKVSVLFVNYSIQHEIYFINAISIPVIGKQVVSLVKGIVGYMWNQISLWNHFDIGSEINIEQWVNIRFIYKFCIRYLNVLE